MKTKFKPGDALLIVDPQIDFMPGGALGADEGDQIIPILNEWINAAQQENIPIFVSRDWHPPDHISFKAQGGPWPVHCVQNTKGAEFDPHLQLPTDAIIINKAFTKDKEAYSAFEGYTEDGKPLPEKLWQLNIKHIWIAGLALDYCVHYSAIDAFKFGFTFSVILPACRSIAKDSENKAIAKMKQVDANFETDTSPYIK